MFSKVLPLSWNQKRHLLCLMNLLPWVVLIMAFFYCIICGYPCLTTWGAIIIRYKGDYIVIKKCSVFNIYNIWNKLYFIYSFFHYNLSGNCFLRYKLLNFFIVPNVSKYLINRLHYSLSFIKLLLTQQNIIWQHYKTIFMIIARHWSKAGWIIIREL